MNKRTRAVSVTIVTYNNETVLSRCLDSILEQDWPSIEIIVVDNASDDGTRAILEKYRDHLHVILNSENRGFAAAQNQALRCARGEWVLVLNPDVRLTPSFISILLGRQMDPDIGTVCGKLLRAAPNLDIPKEAMVDSAGIFFTPTFRHLDRGSNLADAPEYNQPALVFGATAAAALYRRRMIDDISVDGEFFDEDFFLYREDADLSWRAQLLGWRCLYLPDAVAYHVRRVFPGCRRELPAAINRQSVENRFLMRIKNVSASLYASTFVPVTLWDFGVVLYCVFSERSSLPAFYSVARKWKRMIAKRRVIQGKRKVTHAYIRSWFGFRPVTVPLDMEPVASSGVASANARAPISGPAAHARSGRPM